MKCRRTTCPKRFFVASILFFLPCFDTLILPITLNQTETTLLQPSFIASSGHGGPIRRCVADPSWSKFHHDIAPSCERALLALADDKSTYGSSPGIFTYVNGHSQVRFPETGKTLMLPKRYESQMCVVAVVMLKMFEDAPIRIPDLPARRWSYVDYAKWEDLIEPADYVRATCGNGVGFAIVGSTQAVGVLILEAESVWDDIIKNLPSEAEDSAS